MQRLSRPTLVLIPVLLGLLSLLPWLARPGVFPAHAQGVQAPSAGPFWAEDFSAFDPSPYFILGTAGSAVVDNGSFLLTQSAESQTGRIFYTTAVPMLAFTASFDFYLGDQDAADGLAFHFCPVYDYFPLDGSDLDAACPGGYLVAFDTHEDVTDGVYVSSNSTDGDSRLIYQPIVELEDGAWHTVSITFDSGELNVVLDGLTRIRDFTIPGYTPFTGYFGFSAATGGLHNEQRVDNILINGIPEIALFPAGQTAYALPGQTVEIAATLYNLSSPASTFSLAAQAPAWPTTLSTGQTGVLDPLQDESFTFQVEVPNDAQAGDVQTITISAVSDLDPATVTTLSATVVALSGQNGYVMDYDNDSGDGRIEVLDTVLHVNTGAGIDISNQGDKPLVGALSPDGGALYVSLFVSGNVLVVDTLNTTPVVSITVGNEPFGIAFTNDGAYALVANRTDGFVSVIDTATFSVTKTIPVGPNPQRIATSPCMDKAYVINRWDYSIQVIDTQTLTVVDAITGFSNELFDIVISPYGDRAYVTNQKEGYVYVIDTATDTWVDTFDVADFLTGIDISPDGKTLFVTSQYDGVVYALDAYTGKPIKTIAVFNNSEDDNFIWDIEVFPEDKGGYAYVTNSRLGEVGVIDTQTLRLVKTFPTGEGSHGLALFPPNAACRTGVVLSPSQSTLPGAPGEVVTHTFTLHNLTGAAESFSLGLSGAAWPSELLSENTGPVSNFGSTDITVLVTVPDGAQRTDTDTLTLTAASNLYTGAEDTASVTTGVPRPGYVMNSDFNTIDILDTWLHLDTGGRIDVSPHGSYPLEGALSPDGGALYVSLRESDNVLVVDTLSATPVISITVGDRPIGIAFTNDGAYALVANNDGDSVSVIDTATLSVIDTIPVGNDPQRIAVSPCLDKAYVIDRNDSTIHVIDTETLAVTKVITGLNGQLFDIAISPLGDRAYVTNQWDSLVYVIDTAADARIDTFPVPTRESIEAIDVSPDARKLYITGNDSGNTWVLDAFTGELLTTLVTGLDTSRSSWDVEVFPWDAGPFAYVSAPQGFGAVQVINTQTDEVVSSIPIEYSTRGLALFPPAQSCGLASGVQVQASRDHIFAGETITLTGVVTGFPAPIVTWDFEDGSTPSADLTQAHTFTSVGVFNVSLTAENPFGVAADDIDITVSVYVPAVAAFTPLQAAVPVGQAVAFTNASTGSGPLTYAWTFGDGGTSTDANPTHTYTTPGVFPVELTVTGPLSSDKAAGEVTVYVPAVAAFTPLQATVVAGQAVTFTNASTGTGPLTYAWTFGDGGTSTDANPTHTYTTPGVFTVTLTVTGPLSSDTATGEITVTPEEPGETDYFVYVPVVKTKP